ncbi:hypothetical protein NQ318_017162 [Aromia moschata]|uniref:Uncharacterized protein n=1 Tax=Aromia moschata TaxID=1265417 RepID=A0AAV8YMX0_9CUCU|nr:hypothetical protein NQ318_017162 [Aromia moschata]
MSDLNRNQLYECLAVSGRKSDYWHVEHAKRRELSLQEALQLAYAEDDVDITAIYTEPPEISVLSDEDSGTDDDDGDLNRLSGRQLRAAVEIPQRNNVRIKKMIQ